MNCPNNFLNIKIRYLADDSDFDKNFHIQSGESPLYKTAINFKKMLFILTRKNPPLLKLKSFLAPKILIRANYI